MKPPNRTAPPKPPELLLDEGHALQCLDLRATAESKFWLRSVAQPFAITGSHRSFYTLASVEAARRLLIEHRDRTGGSRVLPGTSPCGCQSCGGRLAPDFPDSPRLLTRPRCHETIPTAR
jgi:hypothetical protein